VQQAPGEAPGQPVDRRVVHQVQRLQRRRADVAPGRAGVGVGPVEQGEVRVALDPLGHQIDTSAVCFIDGLERPVLGEVPRRLLGEGVGPADGAVEQPRQRQQVVADGLGVQPAPREAPPQLVVRVDPGVALVVVAGHLVRP
jgi:hypothetical protein